MSVKVLSAVIEHSPSKGNRLLAMIILANNANDDGWAYPAQDTIAENCRVSKRAAQRTLDALEADGEIVIYNRVSPDNPEQHFSNCYHLPKYGRADAAPPFDLRGALKARDCVEGSDVDDTTPSDAETDTRSDVGVTTPSDAETDRVATPAPPDPLQEPSIDPSKKEPKTAIAAAVSPETSSPAVAYSETEERLLKLWHDNIGVIANSRERSNVLGLLERYGCPAVEHGIREAVHYNHRNPGYVEAVAKRAAADPALAQSSEAWTPPEMRGEKFDMPY